MISDMNIADIDEVLISQRDDKVEVPIEVLAWLLDTNEVYEVTSASNF